MAWFFLGWGILLVLATVGAFLKRDEIEVAAKARILVNNIAALSSHMFAPRTPQNLKEPYALIDDAVAAYQGAVMQARSLNFDLHHAVLDDCRRARRDQDFMLYKNAERQLRAWLDDHWLLELH